MKTIFLILLVAFNITAFGQNKPKTTTPPAPTNKGEQVVTKPLYTTKEKEKTRKNFIKDVDSIGMSPEIKAQYTAIVKKHWARIEEANKDRNLTKDQATEYVNKVIKDQNLEIQPILTVEQYTKHIYIMNRYHNSVLYRIEQQ